MAEGIRKSKGSIGISQESRKMADELAIILQKTNQKAFLNELKKAVQNVVNDKFSVAVIGEVSVGKSSLINQLIGKEVLPVDILPTTTMMTRIQYYKENVMIVFDQKGKKKKAAALKGEVWKGLTARPDDRTVPKDRILVGVKEVWLQEGNLELIDTPAGNYWNEECEKAIEETMIASNGVIFVVSASKPLAKTEMLRIRQRMLGNSNPFVMLVITGLDRLRLPVHEKDRLVRSIVGKLEECDINIPVYTVHDPMSDEGREDHADVEKIKDQVETWSQSPDRREFLNEWFLSRTFEIAEKAKNLFQEEMILAGASDETKEKYLAEKEQQLKKAESSWNELCEKMKKRCETCLEILQKNADEGKEKVTERLEFDISHTNAPQKWWKEDYPYRAKLELTNLASNIENKASKILAEDARWFNQSLEKQFKTQVLCEKGMVTEKEVFNDIGNQENLQFEDLDKQRNLYRIGTAALTVAGAALCVSTGGLVMLATQGIGTSASIFSERFFRQKIEKQREIVKTAVRKQIPEAINQAMKENFERIQGIYGRMIQEAHEQKQTWLEAQREMMKRGTELKKSQKEVELEKLYQTMDAYCERLRKIQERE